MRLEFGAKCLCVPRANDLGIPMNLTGSPTKRATSDEHIIQAIASAYGPGKSERISKEEINEYVKSIDFLEDILSFSRTAFIVVEFNPWSYLYCSNNTLEV